MGLFSFLKNAGAKVMTKKATESAHNEETLRLQQELLNRQKGILLKGVLDSLKIKVENLEIDVNGEKVTIYGQVQSQANKEKVILALGNVNGVGAVDDRLSVTKPSKSEAQFYTVKRGDSLSKIAKRIYGDPMKYDKIFKANKPLLKDPNKIYPGQVLRIP